MRVNWAAFGEKNGGHALLVASGDPAFAARITQYTDRPGDPPVGVPWGPVNSGFFFDKHYVLLRTLPDPDAGRAGMVRSYVAYVPEGELVSLNSLVAVFDRLPQTVIKLGASIEPLEVPDASESKPAPDIPGLVALAARLGTPGPLIWASDIPYLPTIDALWGRLPARLRSAFSFAFQFAPEHSLPVSVTLVATLPALAGRWPDSRILPIDAQHTEDLTTAQSWFAGKANVQDFNRLLMDYGIEFQEFGDLNLLSSLADLVTRLDFLTFAETRKAVRIVEKFSKAMPVAANDRSRLFSRLCFLVSNANSEDISTLRNLDPVAVADLILPLQKSIQEWLRTADPKSLLGNLELAADTPALWWSKIFFTWLHELARVSSLVDAEVVLRFLESDKLFKIIESKLPSTQQVESKLVAALPKKVDSQLAENLLRLAEARNWMRLHAVCLARSRSPLEAINAHLKSCGEVLDGLAMLREELGFAPLLRAACSAGNATLTGYTGDLLNSNSDAISVGAVVGSAYWPLIQARAVEASGGEINDKLRSSVIATLNSSTTSQTGIEVLVTACNATDVEMWLAIDDLSSVISQLRSELRLETIAKINAEVAAKIERVEPIAFVDPHGLQEIFDIDDFFEVLRSIEPHRAARAGVNAFKSLSFLSDADCRRWLIDLFTRTQHTRITAEDASEIAAILLGANFPKAADIVRDTVERYSRQDVSPVFEAIRVKYQMAMEPPLKTGGKSARLPKVVIATALALERTEVMSLLGQSHYDGQLYADVAQWPEADPVFEIYVLATGPGNLEAQGAILRLLKQVKPKFAFFIGVAGGMKDSEVGDVIYSTKVYYYEGGKETDDGFKSRSVTEHTSEALVQLALRIAENDWQPKDHQEGEKKPKATAAVVGSGEKVLTGTSDDAATFQMIKNSYNDTQVVDMEAYGFLKALRGENVRHSMVIRGVSDKIAGKSESDAGGSQPRAARNAAAFLFALLAACPQLLRKSKKKLFGLLG
jgi:nucleoside phosphorylase